ncbi:unnamed protein product, partial [Cylicostephanus goldi]
MELSSGQRVAVYRYIAYVAVTFSVLTVLTVCVSLPMVYNYIYHMKRSVNMDVSFCKGSAKDIWNEVERIMNLPPAHNRTIRSYGVGGGGYGGGGGGGGGSYGVGG